MSVTLKDVAQRAGVSMKTVSNVIHGNVYVSADKKERVEAALKELNYQPNLSARYLRKGKVGVIAFALPDLGNSYFSDVANAIIDAAALHSYTVLIDHTAGDRKQEQLVVHGLRPHLIDGVILSPLFLEAEDVDLQQAGIPLVLLGERFLNLPCDHVAIDNVAAARVAMEHLLSLGRRRIAVIGAQDALPRMIDTSRLRLQGYREALTEAGIPLDPHLIIQETYFSRERGAEAIRNLVAAGVSFDAVFCLNDLVALGAIRALHEFGLRIPEDVAVIGFDDIEEGRFSIPSLTTISPDKRKIGSLAVSFLLGRINGTRTGPAEYVEVPFQLVVRESTGCVHVSS